MRNKIKENIRKKTLYFSKEDFNNYWKDVDEDEKIIKKNGKSIYLSG